MKESLHGLGDAKIIGTADDGLLRGESILGDLLDPSGPCGCSENCTCGCQDWAAGLLGWQQGQDQGEEGDADDLKEEDDDADVDAQDKVQSAARSNFVVSVGGSRRLSFCL